MKTPKHRLVHGLFRFFKTLVAVECEDNKKHAILFTLRESRGLSSSSFDTNVALVQIRLKISLIFLLRTILRSNFRPESGDSETTQKGVIF